ncbi:hypothetical protein VTI74DRAFT_3544 [Chaetomium olivicolor]
MFPHPPDAALPSPLSLSSYPRVSPREPYVCSGREARRGTHARCQSPPSPCPSDSPSWHRGADGACAAPSMMPAHRRSPAPSLPPVNDEATVPFSDLFTHGFDPATVDATTQLADRSIFVTSSGRRYRFESIPDPTPVAGRVPTSVPIPTPPLEQPVPLRAATVPSPSISYSPASLPPPQVLVHASDGAPRWGRSPSNASSHSFSSGAFSERSGHVGSTIPGPDPRGSTVHDVTSMMAHLHIHRFGATPLYGESDGGVQTAETLTDPDVGPRIPMMSPGISVSTSPRISYAQYQYPPGYQPAGPGRPPYDYTNPNIPPQYWTNVNYANYTAQTNAHLQGARQRAVATTGLPSLMEDSTPMSPQPHRASDPVSTGLLSPVSPPEENQWEGQGAGRGGAVNGGYYHHPLHPSVSAPPSFVTGRQQSYQYVGGNDIDTLTPVVVHPRAAPSTTSSEGASTGRDNVLPGEDLLFDGPVKSAQSLTAPAFREGVLKVFRNTLTNDLRFHCKVDRESETYWMKASNAQLVPAYAYDQRLSYIVYIRDKESDKGAGYMQASQGNCRPSGIYQFSSLKGITEPLPRFRAAPRQSRFFNLTQPLTANRIIRLPSQTHRRESRSRHRQRAHGDTQQSQQPLQHAVLQRPSADLA